MRNWEIKSRSRFCYSCQHPFQEGQIYHCLLDFSEDEPLRRDYCEDCWTKQELTTKPGKAYWKTNFKRLYTPADNETIKQDKAQQLLERYIQSEDIEHIKLCYILALLQERKKSFFLQEETLDQEGRKIIIYEHVLTGKIYTIRDPHLSLSGAEEVQNQLTELLKSEPAAPSPEEEQNEEKEE